MQPDLLPIRHRSLQPRRLAKRKRQAPMDPDPTNPERIYAAKWLAENRRRPGVNHGFTLLEWVLCPSGSTFPLPVTQRDAEVAASVVQWFGTNLGLAFIRQCEEAIDRARERDEAARRRSSLVARERELFEERARTEAARAAIGYREIHLE